MSPEEVRACVDVYAEAGKDKVPDRVVELVRKLLLRVVPDLEDLTRDIEPGEMQELFELFSYALRIFTDVIIAIGAAERIFSLETLESIGDLSKSTSQAQEPKMSSDDEARLRELFRGFENN